MKRDASAELGERDGQAVGDGLAYVSRGDESVAPIDGPDGHEASLARVDLPGRGHGGCYRPRRARVASASKTFGQDPQPPLIRKRFAPLLCDTRS